MAKPLISEPPVEMELSALLFVLELAETRRASIVFRALRHREFRLFTVGQIVFLIGTWMQNVALSWLVYRLRHSELLLGTFWFCTQIPVFALSLLGGVVSDRFSRHRIVVITQILSMFQVFLIVVLIFLGSVRIWHIMILVVTLGIINAFDILARQLLIVELTSKEDLLSAISLNSAIFNAARIVGFGAAGIIVASFGEGVCFLINAFSFLAVIGCLLAMRLPARQKPVQEFFWIHLKKGFHFAYTHRPVRMLLLMFGLMIMVGMLVFVLMSFFAGDIFQRGLQGLGFLMGAMGIGAVAGTLFLASRLHFWGLNWVIVFSAVSLGASYVIFVWSALFWLSIGVMFFIGFSVMCQMVLGNMLIQIVISDYFCGCIMVLYAMMVVGLGPFGSLAAGALAHAFGARFTVMAGGIVAFLAALTFGVPLLKVDWQHE